MDRSVYVALSGALMQEKRLEVLTDNLSNVNTPGFKGQRPLFEDAMPGPVPARVFAKAGGVSTEMSQGVTEKTERPLDIAIIGDGFISVQTPGGTRYTRDGSLRLLKDGSLVTGEGYQVQGDNGAIKLPSSSVVIDGDGSIREKGGALIERIKVVNFREPALLRREGNLFSAQRDLKEAPVSADIQQGSIEASNVNAVKAMTTMIEAVRSYETQAKLIQTADEMTRKAIDEVGRAY